jgi:Carbohydrate/starch-binding module (family 21)
MPDFQRLTKLSVKHALALLGRIGVSRRSSKNIAYEKRVVVLWRNGDCVDTEASYVRSSGGDSEIWRALSPAHSCWSNEGPGTSSIKFAIRYGVAGKTYWDNNGGWDYRLAIPEKYRRIISQKAQRRAFLQSQTMDL